MAITRSQIARQLLAAGGVSFESPGNTTLQRVLPRMDGQRPGFYGSDAGFGDDDYKDESASFDAGSGSGGSDAQFQATAEALGTPQRKSTLVKDIIKGSADVAARLAFPPYNYLRSAQSIGNFLQNQGFLDKNPLAFDPNAKGPNFFNNENDNNQIVKPIIPMAPMAPKLPTDIEPERSDYEEFVQRFSLPEQYRLADGGEVRQAYGLGSLVKKVTGAVKKVVKSPVGKAALAVGLSGIPFGAGSAGTGFFGSKSLFGRALPFAQDALFGKFTSMGPESKNYMTRTGGLLDFLKTPRGAATVIGGTTLLSGLLTSDSPEEDISSLSSRIADNTGIDVESIRKEVQAAYDSGDISGLKNKYPFLITQSAAAAEGGRIGYDMGGISGLMASNMENDKILENLFEKYLDMGLSPEDAAKKAREEFDRMSKAEEPDRMTAAGGGMMNPNDEMLNLGGNEMDLRGGGFVPLGEYEKKDDVPARLSKNEFVFTADAVKAAGGGSVDRGADLMYKTMKQLENKVA